MSSKSQDRANKAVKDDGPKKRRRKKARTDDFSSDSDSSDAPDAPSDEEAQASEGEEEMEVDQMDFSKDGKDSTAVPDIPDQLRNLPVDAADNEEFQQFYMKLVTTEFGDDLEALRKSKGFNNNSLPILVEALKQGVNVFDADVQKQILS